ncbi:MAG: cytochrome o ubiquinol oxidase subunit IV [Candidatus Saccharimonadales bacterium]
MSAQQPAVISDHDVARGTRARYVTGFILSVSLTAVAFALVHIHIAHHHQYPSDNFMVVALPSLAVVQFFVQMVCFLHMGHESRPHWNAWALAFAATVVLILVICSLWIMSNLNYRMMSSPVQIQRYIDSQGDL